MHNIDSKFLWSPFYLHSHYNVNKGIQPNYIILKLKGKTEMFSFFLLSILPFSNVLLRISHWNYSFSSDLFSIFFCWSTQNCIICVGFPLMMIKSYLSFSVSLFGSFCLRIYLRGTMQIVQCIGNRSKIVCICSGDDPDSRELKIHFCWALSSFSGNAHHLRNAQIFRYFILFRYVGMAELRF